MNDPDPVWEPARDGGDAVCRVTGSRRDDIELRRKSIEAAHQLPKLLAIALQLDQAFLDRRRDIQLLEADLFQGGPGHGHADVRLGIEPGAVGQHTIAQSQVEVLVLILEGPVQGQVCLLYTSPSPRDGLLYRMPSSA